MCPPRRTATAAPCARGPAAPQSRKSRGPAALPSSPAMRVGQTIARLAAFTGRGPGTDAERRAALWLAAQLREGGAPPRVDTFWCRPNWALAHAWHVALALAGSLVAVADARVGLVLVLAALAGLLLDGWRGVSPGRYLTPLRASQNVVAAATAAATHPTHLVITANLDAGRTAAVYGRPATAIRAALRHATGGRGPGWQAWLAIAMLWIAITAALRIHGVGAATAGPLAVVPSAALVAVLALLLEAGAAAPGPAAADNGSGTAVALALFHALAASPPRHLDVTLVLTGAHEGGAIGLRRHLRADKPRRQSTIVLGLAACGHGELAWWHSDGPLLPGAAAGPLRDTAAQLAQRHPELGLHPHRGRGWAPAAAARTRRLPAITLGAVDARGLTPRSHRPDDVAAAIDPRVPDRLLELGLLYVGALDARIGRGRQP